MDERRAELAASEKSIFIRGLRVSFARENLKRNKKKISTLMTEADRNFTMDDIRRTTEASIRTTTDMMKALLRTEITMKGVHVVSAEAVAQTTAGCIFPSKASATNSTVSVMSHVATRFHVASDNSSLEHPGTSRRRSLSSGTGAARVRRSKRRRLHTGTIV